MSGNNGHDRSLTEMEREAERTRAELMSTVDALRRRVSPGALKEDAKDYIRHTGEGVLGGMQQRARENPLQAVAIAAGLAFPIWRIATSIPVPLMLIGAGLALGRASGRGASPGESYGSEFYHQARDKVQQAAGTVRERMHDATDAVRERVHDTTDAVQQTLSGAADTVRQVADQVSSGLGDARERAGVAFSSAAAMASGLASQAAAVPSQAFGSGTEAAQSGMQSARTATEQLRDATARGAGQVRDRGSHLQSDLLAAMERNPLLVGAIGLAAGAVVAAAFPSSRIENRMFGETSNAMKEQAQELASEGAQFARNTATDLYDQALQEARAQGLSPQALRDAVKELGERAKTAAQNATGAAADRTAHVDATSTH